MPARHQPGIVHLGLGAFHRAHQAVYIDDVLAQSGGDWRIVGVSLRSPGVRDALMPQDGLYTVVERLDEQERLRVIGSIAQVLVAPQDPARVIEAIAAPATRIVSLTITEKGYCYRPATSDLDAAHPDIVHDLAPEAVPVSAIGYLAAGLDRRRLAGAGPVTVLSCDNVPHNGAMLETALSQFATLRNPALAAWISANVTFPATMVDRIVPATTPADIEQLAARSGVVDLGMVKTEPFSQWVIEDRFIAGRPPLERVGAQLVTDVRPFELAKLRMLNGSHSTLAYVGLLAGHEFVHQAMADPTIARLLDTLMLQEAAPTLPQVPGLDPTAYAAQLKQRFANAALQHRLLQIAMDGSKKLPQRLLDTIVEARARGIEPVAALTGVAAWMLHVRNHARVDDPLADTLAAIARAAADERALVDGLTGLDSVFGSLAGQAWLRDALYGVVSRLSTQAAA